MRLVRVVLLLAVAAAALRAQEVPPTLGAIVVVAERAATSMNRSTAAITRLTAADLARLPHATVADVLRRVPGFAVVDFDGLGRDPQLMVRGFYGGGEADYMRVMVDGRPVNLVHNGTIAWETLPPLSSIESIEIVRGSASALHGDAAVAGVINIVTRRSSDRLAQWRGQSETSTGVSASVDLANVLSDRKAAASLAFDWTDGFRRHSARTSATARGTMQLSRTLDASLRGSWRDFDEPGPLLESRFVAGSGSDSRFHSDGGDDFEWGATVDYGGSLGAGGDAQTSFRVGGRRGTLVRTLPLAPDYGDTRERRLETFDAGVTTQANLNPTILPFGERLSVGASVDIGSIDSRYYSGETLDADGSGGRLAIGAFAHFVNSPRDWLRWTLGLRLDRLADSFSPGPSDSDAAHFAFSPKAGVNIHYASRGRATGHAWVSASRTFKAPTLDQLFDQRPIPIPFPPFSVTTSNPDLNPQRGTSLEAGIYHDVAVGRAQLGATLTLYQIAMRDELDFDLQTFKYVNIGRSRHRGAEAGLTVAGGIASGFASLTLQSAVSRSGANTGKQLKAIPGQLYSTGATVSPPGRGTLSLSLARTADMFIDDGNTRRIPSWTRVDAQFSWRFLATVDAFLGARNLFDSRFYTTAFPDPSGSGEAYVYPAAGRVLTIGARHGR